MSKFLYLAALVMLMVSPSVAQAQEGVDVPDCVMELDPCGPFVNSTTARPPATCCRPLQRVIENDFASCFCTIFSSIEVIQTLSLNVTEALTLPQRCGFQVDIIAECQALLAPSEAPLASLAKAPSSGLNQDSGSSNIAWTGSAVLGSLLLWATLMFY